MYTPIPMQDRWLSSDEPYAEWAWGRGGGKTTAMLMEIGRWIHRTDFRGLLVCEEWFLYDFGARVSSGYFDNVWDTEGMVCRDAGVEWLIDFPSGAKLLVVSAHQTLSHPHILAGWGFSFIGVDTESPLPSEVTQYLNTRAGSTPNRIRVTRCQPDVAYDEVSNSQTEEEFWRKLDGWTQEKGNRTA